ncbi:MAG: Fe-Mn family superoxide dismutase [Gammaproteobacteria bacterium]|nr:Fe-Mn family superoxide dismutase [Gammaproteobacteria bacterium]
MISSRRTFLLTSSGAALGTFYAPGLAAADSADSQTTWAASGLATGSPIPLRNKSIPDFLSEKQLAIHHTSHYGGALRGYSTLDDSLQSETAFASNALASMLRSRVSKGNSVILHEIYFARLAVEANKPQGDLAAMIRKRFGSFEKWEADFVAAGKSAAGWALLVHHPVNGKLYNVASDEHAVSVLWMATPLVAMDTYEHAFYLDYENRKAQYVEKFVAHIDWQAVQSGAI